jgi:protein gp37
MGDKSKIGWTNSTWNPIRGCSRVSKGCIHCYAEVMADRFSGPGLPYEGLVDSNGRWNGTIKVVDAAMDVPLRWRKPRRIFVNSMSDLFHEKTPKSAIDRIFAVMAKASHHTFQVLTKRDELMRLEVVALGNGLEWPAWPLPNVWLGVSVENRDALSRIDNLRETPAAVRFLSIEPLLEGLGPLDLRGIHWVIIGGESGPGARFIDPDWIRDIIKQCQDAGIPVFFKQWGEYLYFLPDSDCIWGNPMTPALRYARVDGKNYWPEHIFDTPTGKVAIRVGTKASGNMIDSKIFEEFPA